MKLKDSWTFLYFVDRASWGNSGFITNLTHFFHFFQCGGQVESPPDQHDGQSSCHCVIQEDVLIQLFPPDDECLSLETCRGRKINTLKKVRQVGCKSRILEPIHNIHKTDPILSQMNPVKTLTYYILYSLNNSYVSIALVFKSKICKQLKLSNTHFFYNFILQFITENCVLLNSFTTDDVISSLTLERCSSQFTHRQLQRTKIWRTSKSTYNFLFPFHDRDTKIPLNRLTMANTIIFSNEKPTFIFHKIRKLKVLTLAKQKYIETAHKEMGDLR
jgi:hypothetical protein